jgi:hypothetical protein
LSAGTIGFWSLGASQFACFIWRYERES